MTTEGQPIKDTPDYEVHDDGPPDPNPYHGHVDHVGHDSYAQPGDPDLHGSLHPPKVPSRDTTGRATHAVDAAALNAFADNLDVLKSWARQAKAYLNGVTVPAGAFPQGIQLKTNVLGPTGDEGDGTSGATSDAVPVVSGSRSFLNAALDALTQLQADTRRMARIYQSNEDLSTDQAGRLTRLVDDARVQVQNATGITIPGASDLG